MKQQTAVEWLEYKLLTEGLDDEFIKQAKQMEKLQITKAYSEGLFSEAQWRDAEQYYNETYNK